MPKKDKFNLTGLLSQRSKEIQAAAEEKEEAAEQEETKEEIVTVDVFDLVPSKENFYHVDADLKQSIELVGVLQPLLVNKPENGKYKVIAGHRRRLAVLELVKEGKEERRFIPCVYKKDDVMDRLAIIMANRFRDKTDWEKMTEAVEAEELAKELKKEYSLEGRTREVLSEITGVTEAQLGRYKAIYKNLIPELMAEFKADNIGVSVVYEVSGMKEDYQQQAAELYREQGILTLPDVKRLKQQQENNNFPGQMSFEQEEQEETEDEAQPEEESKSEENDMDMQEEYVDPQPDTVTSLCYSCENYQICHEKKSTVTSCNAYIDREEARKTREQRYNEEQERLDRETREKLKEQQQEAKMQQLPSDKELKEHEIKIAVAKYEEITSEKLTFLLTEKDGYKDGEEVSLLEYEDGAATGRKIKIKLKYIWEDWTGLDDAYCIIGFSVIEFD